MPGPPGELITTEKIISSEWHQKSPTYGYVAKLFLESDIQHKGNKQTKNASSQQNLAVFWAATDSDIYIYSNTTQKGTNKKFGQKCHR